MTYAAIYWMYINSRVLLVTKLLLHVAISIRTQGPFNPFWADDSDGARISSHEQTLKYFPRFLFSECLRDRQFLNEKKRKKKRQSFSAIFATSQTNWHAHKMESYEQKGLNIRHVSLTIFPRRKDDAVGDCTRWQNSIGRPVNVTYELFNERTLLQCYNRPAVVALVRRGFYFFIQMLCFVQFKIYVFSSFAR